MTVILDCTFISFFRIFCPVGLFHTVRFSILQSTIAMYILSLLTTNSAFVALYVCYHLLVLLLPFLNSQPDTYTFHCIPLKNKHVKICGELNIWCRYCPICQFIKREPGWNTNKYKIKSVFLFQTILIFDSSSLKLRNIHKIDDHRIKIKFRWK